MKQDGPIGIFDSGVGGTSIWKEIHLLMPWENTLYLADSKHAPYGNKSASEIIALSKKNTEFLIRAGAKIIVVACNTATTNAIAELRASYSIPFIGIEPAIKPAALHTQSKTIGILATRGTLSSALFNKTSETIDQEVRVIEVIGEGLVPLVEDGLVNPEAIRTLLRKHLQPMIDAKIDYLVLGCSHYPYLISYLKEILPSQVTIIDSGEAVARQTNAILVKHQLLNSKRIAPTLQFYSNASLHPLKLLLKDFHEVIQVDSLHF